MSSPEATATSGSVMRLGDTIVGSSRDGTGGGSTRSELLSYARILT